MGRTRLDEIVSEEMDNAVRAGGESVLPWGKHIAERAFRHGVEQAQKRCDAITHDDPYWIQLKGAQPAPAEKRKGERRKGLELLDHRGVKWYTNDTSRQEGCTWAWCHDRRTGKDRRRG
jgi:hypothetical protein